MAERSDVLVFFGATGDLAFKAIYPALLALHRRGELGVPVIGVAKSAFSREEFRAKVVEGLSNSSAAGAETAPQMAASFDYVSGDYADAATFEALRAKLVAFRRPLVYLAIPPSFFPVVIEGLAANGATGDTRIMVEKPFGRDAASARTLNAVLHRYFPEEAIFRIDHFLGKEAVQNLLYTRLVNGLLEPVWNRANIRSVQITMAENFGIKERGRFYEEAGAIRDVLENHLLQVLAAITMDPPATDDPQAAREENARLLRAVRTLEASDIVRGQYRGYRTKTGVSPSSKVETYVAARLLIDNWRWSDVPFYIRTGKCLPHTVTEVMVEFRRPPREIFGEHVPRRSNHLRLRLSPEVVIALGLRVKQSGDTMTGEDVELIATHKRDDEILPYERLIGDALCGDTGLFASEASIEAQWRIVDDVLGDTSPLYQYEAGTWGPVEAAQLAAADGGWYDPLPEPERCPPFSVE
jgi:glucose-6-phosphate 1-dehydrogenase